MRPPKHIQGSLRHPLNQLLGTESSVRVLREILLSDIPIGITELARRTLLQASGLPSVCKRLEDLGAIEQVGRGHSRQYRRSARSQLVSFLTNAFNEERAHTHRLLSEIRQSVQSASGMLRAAWIEGPVARDEDRPEDSIVVVALTNADSVETARTALWSQLLHVQAAHNVSIELRVETEADLLATYESRIVDLETAVLLLGAPPIDLVRPRKSEPDARRGKTHESVDANLSRLGRAIAEELRADPSLIEDALLYIDRHEPTASASEQLALREWKNVLTTMSASRVRRLLVEDSARGRRLRQSLPFQGTLTPARREQLLREDMPAQ